MPASKTAEYGLDTPCINGDAMIRFGETLISYVWPVTLSAAAGSFIIFFILVIVRHFGDKRRDGQLRRRREIEHHLLIHMSNPLSDLKAVLLKDADDMEAVAQVAPPLLRFLKGNSYRTMLASLEHLGLYDWSLRQLDSRNRPRKIAAIALLAHWPKPEVKDRLATLLEDRNHLVQFAAVEALALSRDAAYIPVIIEKFKSRESFSAPLMADVFRKYDQAALAPLAELLGDANTPVRIKTAALMALSRSGDRDAITAAALPLCGDADGELRALAYMSLFRTGRPVDVTLLRQGMQDREWRVRQYVADCASLIEPMPTDILGTLLKDENWLVGLRAGHVLLSSGAAGAKLLDAIARSDSEASERAGMLRAEHERIERGRKIGLA